MMTKNPILDELHAVRRQLLAEAGGSLDALLDRLQAEEQKSTRPRFSLQRTNGHAGTKSSGAKARENQSALPGER
jgi:hypothetical protein